MRWGLVAVAILGGLGALAEAAPPAAHVIIAVVKVARGGAWIQRAGTLYPVWVGTKVWELDVLVTGADGSLGVTFQDETLLALGPNTALGLLRYAYDPVTHAGEFNTVLYRGTVTMSAGRLVRKSSAAMSVTTPRTVVRVRGTAFAVRVDDEGGTQCVGASSR